MSNNLIEGISVVICTYNGGGRIGETLKALHHQDIDSDLAWEILIIDNNSTDDTGGKAKRVWNELGSSVELRVTREEKAGTMHARKRGIVEARYSILLYCDDDNWFDPGYVQEVWNIMTANQNIVGCGGTAVEVFEENQPEWFHMYKGYYACISQGDGEGFVDSPNLFTAGLAVRTEILQKLYRSGFQSIMSGRSPKSMVAGEDYELTCFLSILGYQFWFSPKLVFKHFMTKDRMNRKYLNRLTKGIGEGEVRLIPYKLVYSGKSQSIQSRLIYQVLFQSMKLLLVMLFNPYKKERKTEWIRLSSGIKLLLSGKVHIKEDIRMIQEAKNKYHQRFKLIS